MQRKLTSEEIGALHAFVRKHYVEFYDVELELVDYLANDIETQWQKDTQLSFEQALEVAFKKFGVFGFSDVVELKVNQLYMSYVKMILREVGSFLTVPKIIFSFALYLLLFTIGYVYQETGIWVLYIIFFLLTGFYLVVGTRWQKKLRRRQRDRKIKFLLEDTAIQIYAGGAVFSGLSIFIQLPNLTSVMTNVVLLTSVLSLLLLFMGLWCYVAIFILKPQLEQEIHRLPQQYQLH